MPYLDSKISGKHKAGCKKPKAKRLYIRDYGDKGQQIFIPYGITCPSCKVIVLLEKNEKEQPTVLSKKQLAQYGKTVPCIFCGNPCLRDNYTTFDNPRGGLPPIPKQYRASPLTFYYPDRKEITDSSKVDFKSKNQTYSCQPCHIKHFGQVYGGKPRTELGKKIVAEHCTVPYPVKDKTKPETDTEPKPPAKPIVYNKPEKRAEPEQQKKKDQRFKELEKTVSRFGELKYCVVCHKPTTASYYGLIQQMNPTDATNARRYGGTGLKCYYPDGKQNGDVPMKDCPVCCNRCDRKHFEQSYKDGKYGDPITDVGRRIVQQYCIFPYPEAKE